MKKITILLLFLNSAILFSQENTYTILVSFDGFRWDYLNRGITPNLNKIAESGVKAISMEPCFPSKTFPNHLSIITGMYPENHGIISNYFENSATGEIYKLGDTSVTKDENWYTGEFFWETANKNGIKTACYFWPASDLRNKDRRPTYFKDYVESTPYEKRIEGVLNWLQLPLVERPHFITLYFELADDKGHRYGPNSDEVNQAIMRLDSLAGMLVEGINNIGLTDETNLIFVSDHGMTEVSNDRVINIDDSIGELEYRISGDGPFAMIDSPNGRVDKIYQALKQNEKNYKVYLKEDVPDNFHYSKNPLILPILIVADLGWSITTDKRLKSYTKYSSGGNHGFANYNLDMHAIFLANGPSFKNGLKIGSVRNIDIYPLLCAIYNIPEAEKVDGSRERIKFVLK
ncbi:MAG: ectonucleotide pyrophosphatase/phosphodiesterase [Melioribacteraceae bacterium]|nr:ectonucleotide pyrophosphatase/phosphodiesterase [Melioribacteraceae bacterium]